MYTGDQGIYTYTFELERKENCPVCGVGMVDLQLKRTDTVNDLIEMLLDKQEIQLKRPSLRSGSTTIYMQAPAVLEQQTRGNLTRLLVEFVEDNGIIDVTDLNLPISLCLRISFE
jgi:ubiquitin-activating enzyme E1 C